jgi:hypothetical protein
VQKIEHKFVLTTICMIIYYLPAMEQPQKGIDWAKYNFKPLFVQEDVKYDDPDYELIANIEGVKLSSADIIRYNLETYDNSRGSDDHIDNCSTLSKYMKLLELGWDADKFYSFYLKTHEENAHARDMIQSIMGSDKFIIDPYPDGLIYGICTQCWIRLRLDVVVIEEHRRVHADIERSGCEFIKLWSSSDKSKTSGCSFGCMLCIESSSTIEDELQHQMSSHPMFGRIYRVVDDEYLLCTICYDTVKKIHSSVHERAHTLFESVKDLFQATHFIEPPPTIARWATDSDDEDDHVNDHQNVSVKIVEPPIGCYARCHTCGTYISAPTDETLCESVCREHMKTHQNPANK